MHPIKRFILGGLVGSFLTLAAVPPTAAVANETGKKHTAITIGAAAAGLLLTHHTGAGILTAGAAGYSYSQYQREHQHNKRVQSYRKGYQQAQRDNSHQR